MRLLASIVVAFICVSFGCGCQTGPVPTAWTASDQRELASRATKQFIDSVKSSGGATAAPLVVALGPLRNDSNALIPAPISGGLDHMWDHISSELVKAGQFTVLSRQKTEIALRDAGLDRYQPEEFLSRRNLPAILREFEGEGVRPDYLLLGRYTTLQNMSGRVRDPNRYGFSLIGVDIRTGVMVKSETQESVR